MTTTHFPRVFMDINVAQSVKVLDLVGPCLQLSVFEDHGQNKWGSVENAGRSRCYVLSQTPITCARHTFAVCGKNENPYGNTRGHVAPGPRQSRSTFADGKLAGHSRTCRAMPYPSSPENVGLRFLCNVHYDLNLPGHAYWHCARDLRPRARAIQNRSSCPNTIVSSLPGNVYVMKKITISLFFYGIQVVGPSVLVSGYRAIERGKSPYLQCKITVMPLRPRRKFGYRHAAPHLER